MLAIALGWLSSTRVAAAMIVLAALLGSAWAAHHYYLAAHDLEAKVSAAQAETAAVRQDAARNEAALVAAAAEAQRRAANSAAIHRRISDAPASSACATSPAIRAALDGLRGSPGYGAASSAPGVAAGVRTRP